MTVSHPNHSLRRWRATHGGDQESLVQGAEVEAPVEAVREGGEISSCVFSEGKRVVAACEAGFEVAQDRVDPLELGHVFGLAAGHDGGLVSAACGGDGTKAGQAIGEDRACLGNMAVGPLLDGIEGEAGHGGEFDAQGVPGIIDRDGGHERDLVLRAATDLAATALAAEVGVIHQHLATENIAFLSVCHGPHQFVVDKPGGGVAHAQLSFERQRRQARLGLADEVDGEKPGRQRKLRALKHRAGDERGLKATGIALEDLVGLATQDAVAIVPATWAKKTVRPTRRLYRVSAS